MTPIPVPSELTLELSAALTTGNGRTFVTMEDGRPAGPLRGGEDSKDVLLHRARLMERRFTYAARPARGISLFAATGDLDARAILGTKFRRFETYHRIEPAVLAELGLLLPTFTAPHWTFLYLAPDGSEVGEDTFFDRLLAILGPALDNPKYEPNQTTRGE